MLLQTALHAKQWLIFINNHQMILLQTSCTLIYTKPSIYKTVLKAFISFYEYHQPRSSVRGVTVTFCSYSAIFKWQGPPAGILFIICSCTQFRIENLSSKPKLTGSHDVARSNLKAYFQQDIRFVHATCTIFHHIDDVKTRVVPQIRGYENTPFFLFFFFTDVRGAASNSAYHGYPELWILRYPAHRYH
jgi:hypothetical protein